MSHISHIRASPVLRLPDSSTFLWLGMVTARSADRPVLTRGAASYPPGLAALCRVPASIRGLRLARSPLAIASRRPRLAPNPGYCLPARSAAPLSPPTPRLLSVPSPPPSPPTGWAAASASDHLDSLLSVPRSLSLSVGWAGALGAAERAGRCYPRFGAERRPPPRVSGAVERAA